MSIEGETLAQDLEWWERPDLKEESVMWTQMEIDRKKAAAKRELLPVLTLHIDLLRQGGFIQGEFDPDHLERSTLRLTMQGYDLLELLRSPLWLKIKARLEECELPLTYLTITKTVERMI